MRNKLGHNKGQVEEQASSTDASPMNDERAVQSKYPEYVYEDVGKRLGMTKAEIDNLSREEVFKNLVAWTLGYSQWAGTIKEWVKDIYHVNLDER